MIGDCTLIGEPHVDRLAIMSRATVAAPAFIGAGVTLIDSVVLGKVELRYVTLIGVRISGQGRIAGRTYETDDTHIIVRADLEVWQAETVRLGPHVDWQGVALLGTGRVFGHVTIEPIANHRRIEALPETWRAQDYGNCSVLQCAEDLEYALGKLHTDPFMGATTNAIKNTPGRAVQYRVKPLPNEP